MSELERGRKARRIGIESVAIQDVLRGNKVQNGCGYKKDGGAFTMTAQGEQGVVMLKQNQRREVRSGKQAGALPASQSSTQAQFVVQQHHGKVSETDAAPCLASNRGGGSAAHPVIVSRARGKFDGKVGEAAPAMTTSSYDCNHLVALYDKGVLTLRRLMPIECERLQGWPDDWTRYGCGPGMIDSKGRKMARVEMSDTQRYRMTGNGVCVPVVAAIVESLKKAIKK